MGIAERGGMLESNATARGHFPPGCRAVMLEHRTQTFEQMGEVGIAESGSFRQLGVDEHMGTVEAIGYDVLAAHGAILRPLVTVVALLTFGLFLLVGRGHARDRDFKRKNCFHRTGEGELHRSAHLTGIDTGAHHSTKSAHIEEVVAHELGQRPGLPVVLRIELAVFPDLFGVAADRLIGFAMAIVENGAFLHIDAVARLIALGKLSVIADFALQ